MAHDAVIVRAGRQSTHGSWRKDGSSSFDLIVAAYEDLPPQLLSSAERTILIPGAKVAGWRELFHRQPDLLRDYDQIALLDDDLICTPEDIEAAFEAGRRYKLSLWQPSLTWNSYFSYAVCLKNPLFRLRYVNFIEMMCPFFSADHLARSLPLFDLGLETGIDRLWCRLRADPYKAYAVLDSVTIAHTRPVGTNQTAQGFADVRNSYQNVVSKMEADLGIYFRGPVAYAGITTGGREIAGRFPMAVLALGPLVGWKSKVNKGWFYKPITDHARHNLTRPVDNALVDLVDLRLARNIDGVGQS